MKKIEAVIRSSRLEKVKNALRTRGVEGITITNVMGIGTEKGPTIKYRGAERTNYSVPEVKLETIVRDEIVNGAVEVLYENAHTGDIGDGIIYLTDVPFTMRIRTGETVGFEPVYA